MNDDTFKSFYELQKHGENIDYQNMVFTLESDLTIKQCKLDDFVAKHKEKSNTPFGIQDTYFVEKNILKYWFFGQKLELFTYDSEQDAKNALKALQIELLYESNIAPHFYSTREDAQEAIVELYTEDEISELLELDK